MCISGGDEDYFPPRGNITQIDSSANIDLSINFYPAGAGTFSGSGFGGFNQFAFCNAVKSTPGKNFYMIGCVNAPDYGFSNPTAFTNNDAFEVGGGSEYYSPGVDMMIAKINKSATNDTVWTKTIGIVYTGLWGGSFNLDSTRNDVPTDFYYDKASNGLYITGYTADYYNITANGYPRNQEFIMKTDTFGNPKWLATICYGSGEDFGYESGNAGGGEMGSNITQVPGSTDYMVVGEMGNADGRDEDGGILLTRITNSGTVVWVHQINWGSSGWGYSIVPTTDGHLLIGAAVYDAASGWGDPNEYMLEIDVNGNFVAGAQIGTAGQIYGQDEGAWWGPKAVQLGTGSYAIMGETYATANTTFGGAMVTKMQRSGASSFALTNNFCGVTSTSAPSVTDVSPASAHSIKAQIRYWNGVTSAGNAGLNPRVGGYYYGYSIPIAVNILTPGTNIVTVNYSSTAAASTVCALPIKLLSFTGEYSQENDCTNLQWVTATETNNHYFFIQRSTDGENWVTIDTTEGAGNSDQAHNYTAIDHHPPVGVDYYRLIQEDYDGKRQTFNVIPITVTAPNNVIVYPNPVSNNLTISGRELQSAVIYNMLGEIIWSGNITDSKITVNVSSLAEGVYIAQTTDQMGKTTTLKFTKER